MAWWYKNEARDTWIAAKSDTAQGAAEEGREEYEDGEPFQIAQGVAYGPFPTLFDDPDWIADVIDDANDDRANEDTFTAEANIDQAALQRLCDELNAVWAAFVEREKPTSNLLNLGPPQTIPATQAWLDANAAAGEPTNKGSA